MKVEMGLDFESAILAFMKCFPVSNFSSLVFVARVLSGCLVSCRFIPWLSVGYELSEVIHAHHCPAQDIHFNHPCR